MTKVMNCFLGKSRGGIEVVALDYANAVKKLGYESEILTLDNRNYTDFLKNGGLNMHYVCGRGLNPITVFHFAYLLKKSKPDVVFLHGTKAVEFGTSGFIRLCFPNIKFIGVSHGVFSKKYKKLKYAMGIATFIQKELQKIGIEKTFCCPNTTQVENNIPPAPSHAIPVIGAIGRDSPIKGWDILFDALGKLKQKSIPFKCKVSVKKDNYAEQINRLNLNDDIDFLGWVSDKRDFFSKTDIYCLPSRGEGMPLTILEAMMYGKPVAVSDCPGSVEIVKNSESGFISRIGNSEQLAEHLEFFLTHPDKILSMGAQARKHILAHFNNEHLPDRLQKIIQEVQSLN